MKLYSMASLLQRGITQEGINVPFFPKEKKNHQFIKSINVNETSTLWTSKLHFPIISDTFTIPHLVTWKLGVFRYLCEDFVMWLTVALGKCQKRSDVIIIAGVLLPTLRGDKGSWSEFRCVDFFLVFLLLNNVRNRDC